MKLIVGLGNIGAEYERTRHNAGFMALDRLASRHASSVRPRQRFHALTIEAPVAGQACMLMKPMTYMNRSGLSVQEAVRFYKLEPASDLLVLVDDVALPAGKIRVRAAGSPGGHNGLDDVGRMLGTQAYPRCRIGVDPPGRTPQRDYVLRRFSEEQWTLVEPALERAADAAQTWAARGVDAAMNEYNAPAEAQERQDMKGTDNDG